MDETSFNLCLLLMDDSRIVYRELADEVGLSVNAVHGRIKQLTENKIIQGFTAHIGKNAINGSIKMIVHGNSIYEDKDVIFERISKDRYTEKIVSTSEGYHYIYGLLPNITDMSEYVEEIPKITGIENPRIFLPEVQKGPQGDFEFKKTDYKIIQSLHRDARKSFSKIADELGVSTKTVRRRVNLMEKNEAIDYTIRWYPIHSDDFISMLHAKAEPDKRNILLNKIKKNYHPNIFRTLKAANEPDKILLKLWANNLKKSHEIKNDLREEELKVTKTRMFYDIEYFPTWRDSLLENEV